MTKYYVYRHYDPEDDTTVYIGHGSGSRAWHSSSKGYLRKPEHSSWFDLQSDKGLVVGECVEILHKGLDKKEAKRIEAQLIQTYQPVYNIHKGLQSMTNKDFITKAKEYRSNGLSYSKISLEMNLGSPMTAWRYVNGGV